MPATSTWTKEQCALVKCTVPNSPVQKKEALKLKQALARLFTPAKQNG